jgi:3-hydroxyisobutyrate dehydrogenase-like beta-hydroxyacid dehydrogenase
MADHVKDGRRVSILGAGRMGTAMAASLRRAGFELGVWNRTPSKAEGLADEIGCRLHSTAGDAVSGANVVLSSLADDEAVRDVYLGAEGAAAALDPGTVVLEMSTIAPRTVREVLPAVEERGAALLDAPVSGSVAFAEKGELTVMVGGDSATLDRARPVLEALSKRILHVGDLGAGATMKLAVNALVHAINVAVSEALVLAERSGVDRTTAYEVLASGAGAAPFVLYKRAAFERPDETPVAFSLDLVAKDLDLILSLGQEVGVRMDQAEVNRDVVRAAIEAGLGSRDLSAVAVFLREKPTA